MLGIQTTEAGSTVVAWTETGLQLIGSGRDLSKLVGIAKGRADADAASAVVAVPAWFHDGQRSEVRDRVLAAGVGNVRIVNEPVAIALAYGMTQPALPKNSLVLSLSEGGTFDVTVLALRESHLEVMAADGIPELGADVCASGKSLFAAIEPVVKRALADAGMSASNLEAIVLAGRTAVLRSAAREIEAAWGRKPAEPPSPERAIADGAAICGRMTRDNPPVPAPEATTSPKAGCAGGFALILAVVVAVKLLAGGWLPG